MNDISTVYTWIAIYTGIMGAITAVTAIPIFIFCLITAFAYIKLIRAATRWLNAKAALLELEFNYPKMK